MANPTPEVSSVINFHGLALLVVLHEGVEYIYAKPLSDLAGLTWRSAKNQLLQDEMVVLYGTKTFQHPRMTSEAHTGVNPSEGVYIRLDRARMFLARINTRNMKAKGKAEAAEALLELQVEWAQALHAYETHGRAVKSEIEDQMRKERHSLAEMVRMRDTLEDASQRKAATRLINDMFRRLGYPVQADLLDETEEKDHATA